MLDVRSVAADISKDRSVLETSGTACTTTRVCNNTDLRNFCVANK